MNGPPVPTGLRLEDHFVVILYPFRHAIPDSGAERFARLTELNASWQPWWARLNDDLQTALDDTYFFLPYIRRLLFPETFERDAVEQAREVGALAHQQLGPLARKLAPHTLLRLTCSPELLPALNPLQLEFKTQSGHVEEAFSAPASICWIDAALFPQHIGILMVKLRCDEANVSTDRLVDFMYYARQVHQQTLDWALPYWIHEEPQATLRFTSRDLVDYLLQGVANGKEHIDPVLASFLEGLYKRRDIQRYTATGPGQVYGQSFHLFSYACLAPPDPLQTADNSTDQDVFEGPVDRMLYELATCTLIREPSSAPNPNYARKLLRQGQIAFWDNWKGLVLHDNTVFLGAHPSNFTLRVLPRNVESDYLHLYLVTLYQNLRLSMLSGELMRRGERLATDLNEARKVSGEFLRFRNHYWFPEVTFKPQGIQLYRLYQEALGVASLFQAVSDSVHELNDHYEGKDERLISRLLLILEVMAAVLLPAEILSHVFHTEIEASIVAAIPGFSDTVPWLVSILVIAGALLTLYALFEFFRSRYQWFEDALGPTEVWLKYRILRDWRRRK